MSLWQIHYQCKINPDGPTEMIAQREIRSQEEMKTFIEDIKVSHPLPLGGLYLAVPEGSPRFWGVQTPGGGGGWG